MINYTKTGYHGTIYSSAQNILKEQQFKPSTRKNDWLGTGAYFFAYRIHAEQWIQHKRYRSQKTAILAAEMVYTNNQMLDLDDPRMLDLMNKLVEKAVDKLNKSKTSGAIIDFNQKSPSERWCFSCNLYRKLNPDIGIIKYTFPESQKKCGASGFVANQCQICVSDNGIITKIWES